jgi:hypothetical protein
MFHLIGVYSTARARSPRERGRKLSDIRPPPMPFFAYQSSRSLINDRFTRKG